MKKSLFFVLALVFSFSFFGCGGGSSSSSGGGIPSNYFLDMESTTNLLTYTWHINDSLPLNITLYDEHLVEVPDYDYSSAVWSVTPSDAGILLITRGRTTTFTAKKAGTAILQCTFKGTVINQTIIINE